MRFTKKKVRKRHKKCEVIEGSSGKKQEMEVERPEWQSATSNNVIFTCSPGKWRSVTAQRSPTQSWNLQHRNQTKLFSGKQWQITIWCNTKTGVGLPFDKVVEQYRTNSWGKNIYRGVGLKKLSWKDKQWKVGRSTIFTHGELQTNTQRHITASRASVRRDDDAAGNAAKGCVSEKMCGFEDVWW